MSRRRFLTKRSGRPLRPMDWEFQSVNFNVGTTNPRTGVEVAAAWIVLPSTLRDLYTDPTLMATRVFATASLALGTSSGQAVLAGLGIIKWDRKDDTVPPVAELPDPVVNGELDWIDRIIWPWPYSMPAGNTAPSNIFEHTHLSKAKRRIGSDAGILAVASGFNIAGAYASTVGILTDVRCLIKE